jgi:hypothetical protein
MNYRLFRILIALLKGSVCWLLSRLHLTAVCVDNQYENHGKRTKGVQGYLPLGNNMFLCYLREAIDMLLRLLLLLPLHLHIYQRRRIRSHHK